MISFTPGPWIAAWTPSGLVVSANGKSIATIDGNNPQFNARLVAASPDLLEALRGACLLVQNQLSPEGRDSVMRKMEAAIAKAEGRSDG